VLSWLRYCGKNMLIPAARNQLRVRSWIYMWSSRKADINSSRSLIVWIFLTLVLPHWSELFTLSRYEIRHYTVKLHRYWTVRRDSAWWINNHAHVLIIETAKIYGLCTVKSALRYSPVDTLLQWGTQKQLLQGNTIEHHSKSVHFN
jgi:hypothetical protein